MTTPTLRDRARAAAAGDRAQPATLPPADDTSTDQPEPLSDIEYAGEIATAAQVPVHVAFARVMADVHSIAKTDVRDDSGGRYKFRGVDKVVNAVGPALRRHGVLALPVRVFDVMYTETRTSGGKVMQDCTLKVDWLIVGPMGDTLPQPLQSAGQANDTGDKATSKAMSVAQRVMWLTALQVPTNDPTIEQGHDRGERPLPKASDYRDEVLAAGTSKSRMLAIRSEVQRHGLASVAVVNESGDDEALLAMVDRVGRERFAPAPEGGAS